MRRPADAAFTVHAAGIAVLLLLAYAYVFPRWADWNQNSRFDLTVAIVDHGTLSIDCCVGNTGDYARVDGRTYTDKAPGLSLLAVPVYALFAAAAAPQGWIDRAVQHLAAGPAFAPTLRVGGSGLRAEKVRFALALTLASVCVVALPAALFGAVFLRFLLAAGARRAAAIATVLAYGLGTIACVYAGAFYAHQLVAVLCFTAFALLVAADASASLCRCIVIGLLLGSAVISEYPAALLALAIGGFALSRVGFERTLRIALGGLLPVAVLVVYDLAIFGSPLPLGYRYSELWQARHQVGFVSLSTPRLAALWGITGSPYRGLFFLSPILLLALPGFVAVLRRPALRAAGMTSAFCVVAFLLFNASSVMWWGGFAIGPRYLVPMLPFLAWPLAFSLDGMGRTAGRRLIVACLALASFVGVWGLRLAGQQFPEEQWTMPWLQYAWPRLRGGDVARNAGMLLGLRGWWSLLPLLVACGIVASVWWWAAGRCRAGSPDPGLPLRARDGRRKTARTGGLMESPAIVRQVRRSANPVGDWRFAGGVIALVLAVTTLPYVYAYRSSPADREFMGILVNVPDHTQYFAWMRGLGDAYLMPNTLTPEPNRPLFFNLLWWGMARIGSLFGLGPAGCLQVLRVLATVLFLAVVHRLCALFLADRLLRRTAFLVATLTSGFGWILVVLKYTLAGGELYFPLDVFIAEGNTFYCILAQPHFVAAALYAFVFELVLRGEESGRLRWAVGAGLVTLFLGWQHAYDLASVYGVLAGYVLLRTLRDRTLPRRLIAACAVIGALSWWPGAYSTVLVRLEPTWRAVLAQFGNAGVATPPPLHLAILLGPAFLLALLRLALERPWRLAGIDERALFLRAWFLSGIALIYLPVSWNVHLLNGLQIPIAILATRAVLCDIAPGLSRRLAIVDRRRVQHALALLLVLVVVPTNAYLYAWRFFDLSRHGHPYYLRHEELAALRWVETHAAPDDVVLSSLVIGQYVPGLTGTHAYLAHWAQTVDYYGKQNAVRDFFDAATDDGERRAILARGGVDWIFYGAEERRLGSYAPQDAPYLRRVFGTGNTAVYRVVPDDTGRAGRPAVVISAPSKIQK